MKAEPGLVGSDIRVHFDGVKAVDGIDLALRRGEILGLIGPNGAGKTTLLNALSGYQELTTGVVRLDGIDITGLSPAHRSRSGIVRTFQSIRVFERLTVHENVQLGAIGTGLNMRQAADRAWDLLEQSSMTRLAEAPAGSLPHGEERRLGILRALAMNPDYLLLDEPAAGLNESETAALTEYLKSLPAQLGLGLLLVEHDMQLIMRACRQIHVIDYGKTIAVGSPEQIRDDAGVRRAYLGLAREGA